MKKKCVKDLLDVVLVPFLNIKPSDVLFLKNLFCHLHKDGFKTQGEYFLWAQSEGNLTDIWLQDEDRGNINNEDIDDTHSDFKLEAYLPAKGSKYGIEEWKGKKINIPQNNTEIIDNTANENEDFFRHILNSLIGFSSTRNMFYDHSDNSLYFNKKCWVLRSRVNSDTKPMSLSFIISDALKDICCNFQSVEAIIEFINNYEIDIDVLKLFEDSQDAKFSKYVRYKFKLMLENNYDSQWNEAINIVHSPIVNLYDLERTFRKMGFKHKSTADDLKNLNIKLGSLFLNSIEYKSFVNSGGLGYINIAREGTNNNSEWIQNEITQRGMDAIKSFNQVHGNFRKELIHFTSSPIQRVFAKQLLSILPEMNVILKRFDIIKNELFFDKYGKDIMRGEKVLDGASKAGKQKADRMKPEIERKVSDAYEKILKKHLESPYLSFSKILEDIAGEMGIGISTLKKYGIKKTDFPDW